MFLLILDNCFEIGLVSYKYVFKFMSNCQTVSQYGRTIFMFLPALYDSSGGCTFLPELVLSVFLILTIPNGYVGLLSCHLYGKIEMGRALVEEKWLDLLICLESFSHSSLSANLNGCQRLSWFFFIL